MVDQLFRIEMFSGDEFLLCESLKLPKSMQKKAKVKKIIGLLASHPQCWFTKNLIEMCLETTSINRVSIGLLFLENNGIVIKGWDHSVTRRRVYKINDTFLLEQSLPSEKEKPVELVKEEEIPFIMLKPVDKLDESDTGETGDYV